MKKAQITLYVIIAIVLMSAIAIVVYTQRAAIGIDKNYVNPEIQPIKMQVEDCLKSTAENGIHLIGNQGGYISIPSAYFDANGSKIAYSYFKGKNLFPSIETLQSQLSSYINLELPKCADFSSFSDFTITAGQISTETLIQQNQVFVETAWPITIEKGATSRLESFSAKVPVRLGLLRGIAENITISTVQNPNVIDISYFTSVYEKYNITINLSPVSDDLIYSMNDSILQNKPYIFRFAVKF